MRLAFHERFERLLTRAAALAPTRSLSLVHPLLEPTRDAP